MRRAPVNLAPAAEAVAVVTASAAVVAAEAVLVAAVVAAEAIAAANPAGNVEQALSPVQMGRRKRLPHILI